MVLGQEESGRTASKAERLTIGRLARRAGVTVETIRYYQRRGLITQPSRSGNSREYSLRDLRILQHIRLAKDLDFTLSEIRRLIEVVGSGDTFCAEFRRIVVDKTVAVGAEIKRLTAVKRTLVETSTACEAREGSNACPIQRELR